MISMDEEIIKPRVDEIVEHFNVSGVLHVTVDNGSIHTLMFNQHVKVHIAFNKEKQFKELDPLPFVKTESFTDEILQSGGDCDEETIGKDDDFPDRNSPRSNQMISKSSNSSDSCTKKKGPRSKMTSKRKVLHSEEASKEIKPKKAKLGKRRKDGIGISEQSENSSTKNANKSFEFDGEARLESSAESSVPVRKKKLQKRTSANISKQGSTIQSFKSKSLVTESSSQPDDLTATDSQTETGEPQETFFCTYCSQYFKSSSALKSHHKVIESEKYDCRKCTKSFKTKAYLIAHEMFSHPEEGTSFEDSKGTKKYVCKECGKSIYYHSVRHHLLRHTGEKLYKCCVCSLHITSVYDKLKSHLQKHIMTDIKFECKPCHIFFQTRGELSVHQLTHALKCDLCGLVFSTRTGRSFHYKTAHEHDILKCPICGGMYSSEKTLADHMKYHGKRPKKQCPICGEMFVSVRKHMRVVHPDDDSIFMCDKCPKTFRTKSALTQHVNVHHLIGPEDNQRLYSCHICDKQYPTCGGLGKHLLTHSEDKPYVCNICGKACKMAGNLKTHMKVHSKSQSSNAFTIRNSFASNDGLDIGSYSNAEMNISYVPNY